MPSAAPIPAGFHTITPNLAFEDAAKAIEFYRVAFGAEEIRRFRAGDGRKIAHAEIKIGNSIIMLADDFPELRMVSRNPRAVGRSSVVMHIYVEDADAVVRQAEAAGAKVTFSPREVFWGERLSIVADPFGYEWAIATHKSDVSPQMVETTLMKHYDWVVQFGALMAN